MSKGCNWQAMCFQFQLKDKNSDKFGHETLTCFSVTEIHSFHSVLEVSKRVQHS